MLLAYLTARLEAQRFFKILCINSIHLEFWSLFEEKNDRQENKKNGNRGNYPKRMSICIWAKLSPPEKKIRAVHWKKKIELFILFLLLLSFGFLSSPSSQLHSTTIKSITSPCCVIHFSAHRGVCTMHVGHGKIQLPVFIYMDGYPVILSRFRPP